MFQTDEVGLLKIHSCCYLIKAITKYCR